MAPGPPPGPPPGRKGWETLVVIVVIGWPWLLGYAILIGAFLIFGSPPK